MLYYLADAKSERLIQEMAGQGVSAPGIARMTLKGQTLAFKVTGLKNPAALILKQEMLANGGEAALNRNAVLGTDYAQTALLLATPAQYRAACRTLAMQPFGLAALAEELTNALSILVNGLKPISYQARYISGQLDFTRPLVMGIANVTPDSFYDGGKYIEAEAAVERILSMAADGADIIDIGGASSRPGHTPVSTEEELERLLPVLERVAPLLKIPISVDTDKAAVAQAALVAGAAIINDIGGLNEDMATLAAQKGAPVVLMHQGGGANLVEKVTDFFQSGVARGITAGVKREQFILDPGFGFGKDAAENVLLLRHLADFTMLGLPLLAGVSNKRFIGELTGASLKEREPGNIAAAVWAMARGAAIIRVHDVGAARQAADVLTTMLKEGGSLD